MIEVTNNTKQTIEVAINRWGSDGRTGFFAVDPNSSEKWDRTDDRGFVMVLKRAATQIPYFVFYNSVIGVGNSNVTDNGSPINPIGR